jgi:uncharacterized repeat protein (TIGR04138 family)
MQALKIEQILNQILEQDSRYSLDAYLFLREGLEATQARLSKAGPVGHISGQELLEGLRDYGLSQFGPMTRMLLEEWGVRTCEDFGEIVFNMVEAGLLRKTEKDSREDFKGGYDFHEAFTQPFTPREKVPGLSSAPGEKARQH